MPLFCAIPAARLKWKRPSYAKVFKAIFTTEIETKVDSGFQIVSQKHKAS